MPVEGKIGPSIGDFLKQGLEELQKIVIPPPHAPTPQGPVIDKD